MAFKTLLRRKRQITATIGGRLFCLKERLGETKIEYINRTDSFHLFPEIVGYRKKTSRQKVMERAGRILTQKNKYENLQTKPNMAKH